MSSILRVRHRQSHNITLLPVPCDVTDLREFRHVIDRPTLYQAASPGLYHP
jgi:hypothetical protein